MTDGDGDDDESERLRQELKRRLLAGPARVPTGVLERAGRTAAAAFRLGRAVRRRRRATDEGSDDVEEMVRLVGSIGRLKGINMKLGQILSYVDIALPEDLRHALSVLQTHAQAMPTLMRAPPARYGSEPHHRRCGRSEGSALT